MNAPKKIRTAPRASRGQAMIEFAFIMPLLVLLIMGVFDLGRAVYALNVVSSAAREGARYGIFQPLDPIGIQNQAKANTPALDPTLIVVTSLCKVTTKPDGTLSTCPYKPSLIEVTVTYVFQPVTLLFTPMILTGKSEMMIELAPPS